jgi:hypothetical protein
VTGGSLDIRTTPLLHTWPGFATKEIAPVEVGGEKWRRLKIAFPDSVNSHTREQISCFGTDGPLRRHDGTVDILGGGTGLNYASGYRDAGGIVVPTRRRVHAYEGTTSSSRSRCSSPSTSARWW